MARFPSVLGSVHGRSKSDCMALLACMVVACGAARGTTSRAIKIVDITYISWAALVSLASGLGFEHDPKTRARRLCEALQCFR